MLAGAEGLTFQATPKGPGLACAFSRQLRRPVLSEGLGMAEANPQGLEKWGFELEIQSTAMHLSNLCGVGVLGWGCRTLGNQHSGTDGIRI